MSEAKLRDGDQSDSDFLRELHETEPCEWKQRRLDRMADRLEGICKTSHTKSQGRQMSEAKLRAACEAAVEFMVTNGYGEWSAESELYNQLTAALTAEPDTCKTCGSLDLGHCTDRRVAKALGYPEESDPQLDGISAAATTSPRYNA